MCDREKRSPKGGKGEERGERKSTTLMHQFTSFLGFFANCRKMDRWTLSCLKKVTPHERK